MLNRLRILTLTLIVAGLSAAEIELALVDGSRMRGELLSEDEQQVVINEVTMKRGKVTQTKLAVTVDRIASKTPLRPIDEELAERKKTLDGSTRASFKLAQWLLERCRPDLAVPYIREGLELDPQAAWGATLMEQAGLILIKGQWIDEAGHLASTGQVRVGNEIVSATVATLRRKIFLAERERDDLKLKLTELTALAAGKAPAASEKQVATMTTARDKAQQSLDKAIAQAQQDGTVTPAEAHQIATARQNLANAEGVLTKAKKDLGDAQTQAQRIAQAKASLETTKTAVAAADKAIAELTAQLAAQQSASK